MGKREYASRSEAFRFSRRRLVQAAGAGALIHGVAVSAATSRAQDATPVAGATPESTTPGIHTYPRHGTITASPGTEISFRGVSANVLGDLRVSGSESGGHSGVMMPHQDGLGVSFVPDRSFGPGEEVTVSADIPLGGELSYELVFGRLLPNARRMHRLSRRTSSGRYPGSSRRSSRCWRILARRLPAMCSLRHGWKVARAVR